MLIETDRSGTTPHPTAQDGPGLPSDCANPLPIFVGHPGGIAVGADASLWVSDTRSGTIWRVAGDGTTTPVILGRVELERSRNVGTRVLAPAGLALALMARCSSPTARVTGCAPSPLTDRCGWSPAG